jgi:hypothetical protein
MRTKKKMYSLFFLNPIYNKKASQLVDVFCLLRIADVNQRAADSTLFPNLSLADCLEKAFSIVTLNFIYYI